MEPLTGQTLPEDGEQSPSGLLQLCQGLVQDQVSALNQSLASMKREIESVQLANFQAVTCQLDDIKRRADAHDKKMVDLYMDFVCQFGQEIEIVRGDLQAEKEERIAAQERTSIVLKQLSIIVKADLQAAIHEEYAKSCRDCAESSPKSAETLPQMSSKSEGYFEGLDPYEMQLSIPFSTEVTPSFPPASLHRSHAQNLDGLVGAVSDFTKLESQVKDSPPGVLRFSSHPAPLTSTLQQVSSPLPPVPPLQSNGQQGANAHPMDPIAMTPLSSSETACPAQLDIRANAGLSSTGSGCEEGLSNMTEKAEIPNSKWSLCKEHSEFQEHISDMFSDVLSSTYSGAHSATPAMPPADAAAQVAPATMGTYVRVLSPQLRAQRRSTVQKIQAPVPRQATPRSPLLLTRTVEHASSITVQVQDPQQNFQAAEVHSAELGQSGSQVRRLSSRDALRPATYVLPPGGITGTQSVPVPNVPGRCLGQASALGSRNPFSQGGGRTCSISTGDQVHSGKRSPRVSGVLGSSSSAVRSSSPVKVWDGMPRQGQSAQIPSFLRPTIHADNL